MLGTANLISALIQGQQALAVQFKDADINFLCDNGCQLWKNKFLESFKFMRFNDIKTPTLNYWYIVNVRRILVEIKDQKAKNTFRD